MTPNDFETTPAPKLMMTKDCPKGIYLMRVIYVVGAFLVILGSFLPWWCEGDVIWYCYPGIQVHFIGFFALRDNGGLFTILLSVVMVVLTFFPIRHTSKLVMWKVLDAVTLTSVSVFHIGMWLIRRTEYPGAFGLQSIQLGLVAVTLGSLILLRTALIELKKNRACA